MTEHRCAKSDCIEVGAWLIELPDASEVWTCDDHIALFAYFEGSPNILTMPNAETPTSIRPDDRVHVEFDGIALDVRDNEIRVHVSDGEWMWLAPEHVTRIEDPPEEHGPPPSTRGRVYFDIGPETSPARQVEMVKAPEDDVEERITDKRIKAHLERLENDPHFIAASKAIEDALTSDEPPEILSSEDVRQALGIDWAPIHGQLVEQISDGRIFRLEQMPTWDSSWHWGLKEVTGSVCGGVLTKYLLAHFRPASET